MNVQIDSAALAAMFRSEQGPVYRHMVILSTRVQAETRASLKEGFPSELLTPTIVKRFFPWRDSIGVAVGSDHPKLNEYPIQGNPLLVFFWPKVGKVIYAHKVTHPGFADYLQGKLNAALAVVVPSS